MLNVKETHAGEITSMNPRQWPMIRLLFPLLLGILAGRFFPFDFLLFSAALFVGLTGMAIFYHYRLRKNPFCIRPEWMGVLWQLLFLSWGFLSVPINEAPAIPQQQQWMMKVLEPPVWKWNHWQVKALCHPDSGEDVYRVIWHTPSGDSLPIPLQGGIYQIKGQAAVFKATQVPEGFDYREYMHRQGFQFQVFQQGSCQERALTQPGLWTSWVHQCRTYFLEQCQTHIGGKREAGVAEALLFGYKEDLDPDVVNTYSNTGTLHVLAVSGMHVGLLYLLLGKMLFFLERNRRLLKLQLMIILLLLWFYASLTGLSPSVLRAVVMFSFMAIGKVLERPSHPVNSLGAAAFVLLVYDPLLLFDVGFQLSFIAVSGILLLHRWIDAWFNPKHFILQQGWQLISVSLAAQWVTFPLGLLYFHQFPNYFLLSNLLIIPLTTITMYLGIALLAFSWVPLLGQYLGMAVFGVIWLTNALAGWMEALPGAMSDRIWLDGWGFSFLIFLLLCLTAFALKPARINRNLLILALLLWVCWLLSLESARSIKKEIWVYHLGKTDGILFREGRQSVFYHSGDQSYNKKLCNHWTREGLAPLLLPLDTFRNMTMLFGQQKISLIVVDQVPVELDSNTLVILEIPMSETNLQYISSRHPIVLGSQLSYKSRRYLCQVLTQLGKPYYCLRESGSLLLKHE